jgi:putative peptidoglycan lipid II flippase
VVAFLAIGRVLVSALYQTGQFGPEVTRYVWYILAGSTVGLLAATLGRLYSSAFYALGDTKSPLKFATVRVILTGVLGYLFAFPLRPVIVRIIEALGMPIPNVPGGEFSLGAVGLTASAGLAGWVEYLLLRRGLQRRIGKIDSALGHELKLWLAAIAAGAAGIGFDLYVALRIIPHLPLPHITEAILVAGVFGVVYFAVCIVAGVPEARATIRRFIKR